MLVSKFRQKTQLNDDGEDENRDLLPEDDEWGADEELPFTGRVMEDGITAGKRVRELESDLRVAKEV